MMRGKYEGNYIRFVARKPKDGGYDGKRGTPAGAFYVRTERVDEFGVKLVRRGGIDPHACVGIAQGDSDQSLRRLARLLAAMGMNIGLEDVE